MHAHVHNKSESGRVYTFWRKTLSEYTISDIPPPVNHLAEMSAETRTSTDDNEPALETQGLSLLLGEKLITERNMSRLSVCSEKVLVSVINQFSAVPELQRFVGELATGVTSDEGLASIRCWKYIMTQHRHVSTPTSWRTYTMGLLDADQQTFLESAIEHEDDAAALMYVSSSFGEYGCKRVRTNGYTALILALEMGRHDVCMKMLDAFGVEGCSARSALTNGATALFRACGRGDVDVALRLISGGLDACNAWQVVKCGGRRCATALLLAKDREQKKVVRALVEGEARERRLVNKILKVESTSTDEQILHALDKASPFDFETCPGTCHFCILCI